MLYSGPGLALPLPHFALPFLYLALPFFAFLCPSLASPLPCLPDSTWPGPLPCHSLVTLPLDPAFTLALEGWSDTSWWQQADDVQMAGEAEEVMLDARGAGEGLPGPRL